MRGNIANVVRACAGRFSSGLSICLALALSGVALGASPPVGQWFGQSIVGTRLMAVTLKLTGARDDVAGLLLAGSPRQCRMHLADVFPSSSDTWKFSVTNSNGGSCDAFVGKQLTLRVTGKGTFSFDVGGLTGQLATADIYPSLSLNGNWGGRGDTPAPGALLRVHLEASIPSGRDSTWRYGASRSCTLEAEYAGAMGGAEYFSFSHANGGFCDRFADGYVRLIQRKDGDLDYRMYVAGGIAPAESGVLGRMGK